MHKYQFKSIPPQFLIPSSIRLAFTLLHSNVPLTLPQKLPHNATQPRSIASAILMTASPVLGANFVWFAGADCTGSVQLTSDNIPPNDCIGLGDGESTKSISYSGVPTQARFFRSGGSQDFCTNGPPAVTVSAGSGCATAPDGFNFQSFDYH